MLHTYNMMLYYLQTATANHHFSWMGNKHVHPSLSSAIQQ